MNDQLARKRRDQRLTLIAAEKELVERRRTKREPGQPAPDWQLRLAAFPDQWLFDSEKLIAELDRCRELVMSIPNTADRHKTHFAREIAIDSIWNLRETLRYLLSLQREGQRAFGKKHNDTTFGTRARVAITKLSARARMVKK